MVHIITDTTYDLTFEAYDDTFMASGIESYKVGEEIRYTEFRLFHVSEFNDPGYRRA